MSKNIPGCVVIGGAVVARHAGVWYGRRRFFEYLRELSDAFGRVVFVATLGQSSLVGREFRSAAPRSLEVYPVRFSNRGLGGKVFASLALSAKVTEAVQRYPAVIHFFPAGLTPLATYGIVRHARAHLTYFKSDWVSHTRALPGKGPVHAAYWRAMEALEARYADVALFRDAGHMKRVRHMFRGRVDIAQPMLSTSAASAARIERSAGGRLRVLFVGILHRRKGLSELIRAVRLLDQKMTHVPDFIVTIVGGQDQQAAGSELLPDWLDDEVNSAGVRHRLRFRGYIDDESELASEYEQADLFVLPSRFEGFPRAVDEAMSYGLPVIATPIAGLPAVLNDGVDVLFTPVGDPTALAETMLRLLSSEQDRMRLGAAARASYERRIECSAAQQHVRLLNDAWERNA